MLDLDTVLRRLPASAARLDFWSLRLVQGRTEHLRVRQDVLEPVVIRHSLGAMLSVVQGEGAGYAATADLSPAGLREALQRAGRWAEITAGAGLFSPALLPRPAASGSYRTPVERTWEDQPLDERIELLHQISRRLKRHEAIVDWHAALTCATTHVLLATSAGARIEQTFHTIRPDMAAVANQGAETQRRSAGGWDGSSQGGLEQLERLGFPDQAERIAEEALVLLHAPDCPQGRMDLLLLPSQMMLQIHESVGHPLELDRILGDERNYAGTSFVNLDMFGSYRYGSDLLNVTFDPTLPEEVASYGWDDEGTPAQRQYLIRDGILERPLGGACSQARTGLPGVANARACDWNRPPIDRMANLNLEPGTTPMAELIAGIGRGVLMDSNRSWSIDDSRNKFQFGCELGRVIRDGELAELVRNPNYRGISASFWRNLAGVGDADTFQVWGTPNCGKGEPNQMVQTGHASPACLFHDVELFGGE